MWLFSVAAKTKGTRIVLKKIRDFLLLCLIGNNVTFEIFGSVFATIYRIPQIIKLYRTKKGADVSKKSFILHNGAYVSLILYLSLSKNKMDFILIGYYCVGLIQNGFIIAMKYYYKIPKTPVSALPPSQVEL